jgi:predicted transcriptional regulator
LCSKKRDEIQGELDKKVAELEKSNLSKEEIAQQITQLLTKSDFTKTREKLLET